MAYEVSPVESFDVRLGRHVLASASLLFPAGRSLWMWLNGIDGSGLVTVFQVFTAVAVITAVWSLEFADPPSFRAVLFPLLRFVVAYFTDAILINSLE
jgi:hypothetical protein